MNSVPPPPPASQPPPPRPQAAVPQTPEYTPAFGDRNRPWWGPIDVLLGVLFVAAVGIIGGGILAAIVVALVGDELGDGAELPVYALFVATLALQAGQFGWPWIVSRWKGLGLASDWKFRFSFPGDIGYGVLLAITCVVGAGVATQLAGSIVGLDDTSTASNTDIISDNEGSPWLIGVILLVIIGAPLTEELLFRGLMMRVFEKSFGVIAAVIGSTALFTLPHIQPDATWQETVVLLSAIATIGLVLAIGTIQTGRLGAAIIGHFLFNAFGTIATLAS